MPPASPEVPQPAAPVLEAAAPVATAPAAAPRVNAQRREQTLRALDDLCQIPALQSLARGFMTALGKNEVSVEEVVSSIQKDSALCVRVLRMANSVLVGSERRIDDLETAVQMLGVVRVRKAAHALFTLRDANKVVEGFDWRHLWAHALGTAAIADELEKQLITQADSHVYLAGLTHDVGKIVLATVAPDDYTTILDAAWNEQGRLEDLELEKLGVTHREAGAIFGRRNGLPASAIEVISHHDNPELAESHRLTVALVSAANYLSKLHGLGFSGSRLTEADGEFSDLPCWNIMERELGWRPNAEAIEPEMATFAAVVRDDLRSLHEAAAGS